MQPNGTYHHQNLSVLQLELNYLLQMSQYLSIGLPTLFLSNSDYYDDICLLNMMLLLMQSSDEQLRNLSTDKILQKMKGGLQKSLMIVFVLVEFLGSLHSVCVFSPQDLTRRSFIVIGQTLIIA